MSTTFSSRRGGVAVAATAAACTVLALLLVPATASGAPLAAGTRDAGAQQVSGRAAAVTLRATRASVTVGQRVRLVGKARAARGSTVRIQAKVPGRSGWRPAGRVKVQAKGRFQRSVKTRTTGTHRFRACVGGRASRCSRPVKVRVRTADSDKAPVTLTVAPLTGTYDVGAPVAVAGTASSNLVGGLVRLQAAGPGGTATAWSTLGSARVGADGSFRLTGSLSTAGRSVALRVLAPATATTRETTASAGAVQVFGWYYLHDGGAVAEAAGDWCPLTEERRVAGVPASRSIGFGFGCKDDNEAEVALVGQCRSFEARIGLSDDPADTTPDTRYAVRLLVDGVERFHQPEIAPGQAWDVQLDLSGAQRLRLEVPFVSGTRGLVVLGGARVNCAL